MNNTINPTPNFTTQFLNLINRYANGRISIITLFIILLMTGSVSAQGPVPVLVKSFVFGGTVTHPYNGGPVPSKHVQVLVKVGSYLGNPNYPFVPMNEQTAVYTTDDNGHFTGPTLPCYRDDTNQWSTIINYSAQVMGSTIGPGGGGGGLVCANEGDNYFATALSAGGEPNKPDIQNSGPSCPTVGHPVNVTNGNMWIQQRDYNLPGGGGENIKINRYFNTLVQQNGAFGWGWKTDYDESINTFNNNNYLLLINNQGQGIYFYNNGNNTFLPGTVGIHAQLVKNPDNTYDVSYKDGRSTKFNADGKPMWRKDRNGNQTTLTYDANNYLIGITDAFGKTLTLTPNQDGVITQVSDAFGPVASYEYYPGWVLLKSVTYPDGSKYQFEYVAINGKVTISTVKDAFNHLLESHQYDDQGRATTSEEQGGVNKYTFDYTHTDDVNPYTTVTDALNRPTKYYFDKSRGRNAITRTEGNCNCGGGSEVTTSVYDDNLNLTKKVDAYNREVNYTYDSSGNPLTVTDPLGTESFTYNSFGEVLSKTDRMSGVWTTTYDVKGNLLTMTNPLSAVTTLTYTPAGQMATVTNARNKTTGLSYDPQGRLATITDANSKQLSYTYDARSRITGITNQINQTTNVEYDLASRLKKVIFPDTKFVTYTFDVGGRKTGMTDERGNTTTFGYDDADRLIAVTDALGHTSQLGYDLMSNVIASVDALGNVTNFEYDNFNRPTKTIYPVASTGATRLFETNEYDLVGNLRKHTDSANRPTLYDYDVVDRLIKTTDPNLQLIQYEYNLRSQMTKVTDALNQQYVFTYDPLGRQLTKSRAGSTTSYQYDAIGNPVSRTDYKGIVTNYTYDNLSRLQAITYPTTAENIGYTYDDLSRPITATNYAGTVTMAYDNRSRLASVTDVHGKVVSYGYDETGNRTQLKLDGITQDTYVYDQANRLAQMTDDGGGIYAFGYDIADKLISKTLPNTVVSSYTYDGLNRLTRLKDTAGTNVLFDRQYSFNQASQISQIAEPTQTKTYNYDNLDRLTQVLNATSQLEGYGFDAVGNRTGSHLSSSYSYVGFNRLSASQTANYVYDSNGNMVSKADATGTTQYVWDYENRLRQVIKPGSQTANYEYDALGRRSKRIEGTNTTKFTYDGGDVLMDDDTTSGITRYQNLGTDNKLKLNNNGVSKYFIQDHLGSTNALTDGTGAIVNSATYDSYGNATGTPGTRYQFTGREKDDFSGLNYNRARWYDSNLGRFISEDPLGFGGGDINTSAYVGNNPLSATDSSGLSANEDKYYEEMRWQAQQQLLEELKGVIQVGYGFGDNVLLGLSKYLRPSVGVDECSFEYKLGEWIGFTVQMVEGGLGLYEAGAKFVARRAIGGVAEEAELIGKACLQCFEADTLVQTKDGLKPIEKINTDDKVLSYNTETGELEYQAVLQKFTRQADDIYNVKIEGEIKPLAVTGEHPFYARTHQAGDNATAGAEDKGEWKQTRNLQTGDEIRLATGKWAKVISAKFKGKGQVYNFEVANNHNYFVGDLRLLTHNASFPCKWAPGVQTYVTGDKTSLQHVIFRHGRNSIFTNVSKFIGKLTEPKLIRMSKEVIKNGTSISGNGIIHDFGRIVGTDMAGNPTSYVVAYLNSANQIRTMFPF